MQINNWLLPWAACALCISAPVDAAAPLETEDAGVLEEAACEAEVRGTRLRLPQRPAENTRGATLGCGLGARTEAALAFGRSTARDPDDGGRRDSLLLAVKTQWFSDDTTSAALAGGLALGRAVGAPFQFDTLYLTAVFSREWRSGWRAHANLGWVRRRSDGIDSTTWNLAAEHTLQRGIDVVAEAYGDDRSSPWLGAGLRVAASGGVVLCGSFAVQADRLRPRLLTLALTRAFD